ncbi:hypothetical protein L208DRAFT_1064552, partial [Tricholoma matsutake]
LHTCVCRETADPKSDNVIPCKQMGCESKWYHLVCVELEQSPQNWICHTCQ